MVKMMLDRHTPTKAAALAGVSSATVSRLLKRAGLSRLKDLEPAEPARRYVHDDLGDMIHLNIKKFGRFVCTGHRITGDRTGQSNTRGVSWEYLHVCINDASRIAYLKAALAYYRRLGVTVKRVMTDNGPCYASHAFAATCKQLGLKHIRTKPYMPRTNGKAERFIQTALREWAYARAYQTSKQRAQDLPLWTHSYNWHRPHSGIKQQTPVGHLNLNQNNLLRLHTHRAFHARTLPHWQRHVTGCMRV